MRAVRRQRLRIGAALVALTAAFSARAEVDMLDYRLRDLASTTNIDLAALRGNVSVLMFFAPDCPYCFRQARVLNALQESCVGVRAVAVGVNGSRAALQQEMRHMHAEFPVAQIDSRLQADIGEIVATPLMLVGDRSGMLVTWLRGLQDGATLRSLVERIDTTACAAAAPASDGERQPPPVPR
jgi:peroxiredoxin